MRITKEYLSRRYDEVWDELQEAKRVIKDQAIEIQALKVNLTYNPNREVLMCAMSNNKLLRKLIEGGRLR